jgi:hypothetical protein
MIAPLGESPLSLSQERHQLALLPSAQRRQYAFRPANQKWLHFVEKFTPLWGDIHTRGPAIANIVSPLYKPRFLKRVQ